MISNSEPGFFRALIPFERDPSPAPSPASEPREGFGVRHRSLLQSRGDGSAQSPIFQPPSGGGCAEGFLFLSQLEPLETV